MEKLTIAHWAEDDQPREKLRDKGPQTLSNAELLAILIGSGTPGTSAPSATSANTKALARRRPSPSSLPANSASVANKNLRKNVPS